MTATVSISCSRLQQYSAMLDLQRQKQRRRATLPAAEYTDEVPLRLRETLSEQHLLSMRRARHSAIKETNVSNGGCCRVTLPGPAECHSLVVKRAAG